MDPTPQPERTPHDGAIKFQRVGLTEYSLTVEHMGEIQYIRMGGFNAFRVVAAMCLLLGIKLTRAAEKAISL